MVGGDVKGNDDGPKVDPKDCTNEDSIVGAEEGPALDTETVGELLLTVVSEEDDVVAPREGNRVEDVGPFDGIENE